MAPADFFRGGGRALTEDVQWDHAYARLDNVIVPRMREMGLRKLWLNIEGRAPLVNETHWNWRINAPYDLAIVVGKIREVTLRVGERVSRSIPDVSLGWYNLPNVLPFSMWSTADAGFKDEPAIHRYLACFEEIVEACHDYGPHCYLFKEYEGREEEYLSFLIKLLAVCKSVYGQRALLMPGVWYRYLGKGQLALPSGTFTRLLDEVRASPADGIVAWYTYTTEPRDVDERPGMQELRHWVDRYL
jgi:hypothetical protein